MVYYKVILFYNVRVRFLVFWFFIPCIPTVKTMVCFYRVGDGLPDGPDTQSWQHHCRDLADITHTLPQELHLLRRCILDARLCRWHSWLVGHQHREPS